MNRIISLDGLRAISIMMVLLGHTRPTMPEEYTSNFFFKTIANAPLGVNIFFVISGYLITRLLIKEIQNTGRVNIWHFYLRRGLRIFPVFYLYILIILIFKLTGTELIGSLSDLLPASLFLWNYKHFFLETSAGGNWYLGHFWSLAMEEQFYLLWPLTFSYFITKNNGKSLQKGVVWLLLAMPLMRLATYFLMPASRGQIGMMLHTGGDAILIGCAGALIEENFKKNLLKHLDSKWLPPFCLIFLFVISPILSGQFRGAYDIVLGISLNNIAILYVLLWSIFKPSKIADLLNSQALIKVGILSYSLYIWQQLFLTSGTDLWINRFPQNILFVFCVSYSSYYFVEKPLLTLRKKFSAKPKNEKLPQKVEAVAIEAI